MSSEQDEAVGPRRKLSCSKYFDALWFCYSPVHQMQQYYRLGALDNCSGKWSALSDCLMLKTKRASEVELFRWPGSSVMIQGLRHYNISCRPRRPSHLSCLQKEILETREKAEQHIWSFRSPKEAKVRWEELYRHLDEQE